MTRNPAGARRAITSLASGAAALVAFFAILAAALLASVCLAAAASVSSNPSTAEIRAKLQDAAVGRGVPPEILYAIAFQESTWRQFDANGDPLIGFDGLGIGIMQVTSYVAYDLDVERLKTDIDYNIASGADILLEKRTWTPVIGDGDTRCYETWFYAVWAYNGWTADNPYPYQVWKHVADGPEGWWTGVPVTPVPKSSLVNGLGVTTPTPQPAHYWSPTPLPKPTLSAPRAPARVKAGVRFTVSGTLAPRHAAGALRGGPLLPHGRRRMDPQEDGPEHKQRRGRAHGVDGAVRPREDRPLEAGGPCARRRGPRGRELQAGVRHGAVARGKG